MGLFSAIQELSLTLGTMKDLVTTGIANAKLVKRMTEAADKAHSEFKGQFSAANSAFSLKYRKAKEKYDQLAENGTGSDEAVKANEEMEDKLAVFVKSLSKNEQLPLDFRAECEKLAKEYTDSKDAAIKAMENRIMKIAKTDEEKETVRKIFDEAKKDYQ